MKKWFDAGRIGRSEDAPEALCDEIARSMFRRGSALAAPVSLLVVLLMGIETLRRGAGVFVGEGAAYFALYAALLALSVGFLAARPRLDAIPDGRVRYCISGGITLFLVVWSAAFSLLQMSGGGHDAVFYIATLLCAGVLALYPPVPSLAAALTVHAGFILLLPRFLTDGEVLFRVQVNTTVVLVISWMIMRIRYDQHLQLRESRREVEEKTLALHGKNLELEEKTQALHEKNLELEEKTLALAGKNLELEEKSEALREKNLELERLNDELSRLSLIDCLTGAYNRHKLQPTLDAEWSRCRRYQLPISAIMVDIDFFKQYNDRYGHDQGDACIRQVAAVLMRCASRATDLVVRYGGDEFLLILPQSDAGEAALVAEHARREVDALLIPNDCSKVTDHVTLSLGVAATVPADPDGGVELLAAADKALYHAKNGSRNCISVFGGGGCRTWGMDAPSLSGTTEAGLRGLRGLREADDEGDVEELPA